MVLYYEKSLSLENVLCYSPENKVYGSKFCCYYFVYYVCKLLLLLTSSWIQLVSFDAKQFLNTAMTCIWQHNLANIYTADNISLCQKQTALFHFSFASFILFLHLFPLFISFYHSFYFLILFFVRMSFQCGYRQPKSNISVLIHWLLGPKLL
jgi:hypothetical protein